MAQPHLNFIVAGSALIAVTYGLARYAYGLFVPVIQHDLGLSPASTGLIASLSHLAYLLASVASATRTPSLGVRLPTVCGGLCAAGGMLLMGLATHPWLLALGAVIAGMSAGWVYPPMPVVTTALLPASSRDRALAWINAGTSFGVLLSGPVALWAGSTWRMAWLIYAVLAVAALLGYIRILPPALNAPDAGTTPAFRWVWFARPPVPRLLLIAALTGMTAAVYWTFAVEVLVSGGAVSPTAGTFFWVVVGVAGIFGARAGSLLERFGVPAAVRGTVGTLAVALGLVGLFPGDWRTALSAAVLFGTGFILMTGILAVWSVRLFPEAPSVGLGAALLVIGIGQVVGPWLAGILATYVSLPVVFVGAALLMSSAVLLTPPARGTAEPTRTSEVGCSRLPGCEEARTR